MPLPGRAVSQHGANPLPEGRGSRPTWTDGLPTQSGKFYPRSETFAMLGGSSWIGGALLLAHEKNSRTDRRVSSDEFQLSVVADGTL